MLRSEAAATAAAQLEALLLRTTRRKRRRRGGKQNPGAGQGVKGSGDVSGGAMAEAAAAAVLLPVAFRPVGKGVFHPPAHIAAPTATDIASWDAGRGGNSKGGQQQASGGDMAAEAAKAAKADAEQPRTLLGFVSSGGYSWARGHGTGIAHCHSGRLLHLLQQQPVPSGAGGKQERLVAAAR